MEKERRTKALVIVVLLIVIAGLTVAFAALSTTLNINGTAYLDAAKWGIKFKNLSEPVKIGSANVTGTAKIEDAKSAEIAGINVSLSTPGDKVTYTVDLVNEGTINAKIDNIEKTLLTEEQQRYLTFKVTDNNGKEVLEGDILSAGETKNLTITVEFIKDLTKEDLPKQTSTISLSYKLNFVQTDEKATSTVPKSYDTKYGNEIKKWSLSDTVNMTYYSIEDSSADGKYSNGTLIISGTGAIPIVEEENFNDFLLLKLLDIPDDITSENLISYFESLNLSDATSLSKLNFKYKPSKLIIENGITEINMLNYLPINSVEIPNTVTKIGTSTFSSTSLTSVKIPSSVTEIGGEVFNNCTYLKEIYFPSNVTILDRENLFQNIAKNSVIYVPDEETKNSLNVGDNCVKFGEGTGCSYNFNYTTVIIDPTKFN